MSEYQDKVNWLENKGYVYYEKLGFYRFIYQQGDYAACTTLDIHEIVAMPIELIKHRHKHFLELAESQTIF